MYDLKFCIVNTIFYIDFQNVFCFTSFTNLHHYDRRKENVMCKCVLIGFPLLLSRFSFYSSRMYLFFFSWNILPIFNY